MCDFLKSFYTIFSHEKQKAVYIALGGVYNCPKCKKQHKLKYREEGYENISEKVR